MRVLVGIVLSLAVAMQAAAQEWRFAIEEIQGSVQDAYAQRFAELMAEKSGGRVQVSVYPYGTLGTSAQLTELVQGGAIQLAFASPGHLGSVVPESQIFSLHFLFPEEDAALRRLLERSAALHELLGAAYREKNLDLLAIVTEGWMAWTGNRPLRTPADFGGFKMRTMVSPLLVEAYKAYGANPTPMPYAEVYGALQLNMIDGQVNPVFAIEEMSFYEVQQAMTFPRHLPFIATVVANPQFVATMAPDIREAFDESIAELNDYIFEVQKRFNRERLEKIRASSDIEMVELTDAEREVFRQRSLPVRDTYVEMAGERGRKILDALLQERDAL